MNITFVYIPHTVYEKRSDCSLILVFMNYLPSRRLISVLEIVSATTSNLNLLSLLINYSLFHLWNTDSSSCYRVDVVDLAYQSRRLAGVGCCLALLLLSIIICFVLCFDYHTLRVQFLSCRFYIAFRIICYTFFVVFLLFFLGLVHLSRGFLGNTLPP